MARAGLTRRVVTDHALAIIDDGGPDAFAALTLASVAARAGVAMPSLYKHIGSLAELRRDISVHCVRELTRASAEATIGRAGRDAIAAFAHAVRDYARRAPARYLATQKAANPHDPADAELAAVSAETVEMAAGVLRGYPIPEGRRVDAIRALRSAVHGFVLLEVQGGFGLPESVDDSFETLIAMAAGGLADPALWVLQEVGDGPRNVRAHIAAE